MLSFGTDSINRLSHVSRPKNAGYIGIAVFAGTRGANSEIPESKGQNDIYLIGANSNNADSYTDSTRAGRYKQISLVENKSFNRLQDGASADDYSLFYEGDVFSSADSVYLTGGKFNDKTPIGFDIEITSIGTSASLKVACTLEA